MALPLKIITEQELEEMIKKEFPTEGDLCAAMCEKLNAAYENLFDTGTPIKARLLAAYIAQLAAKQHGCVCD